MKTKLAALFLFASASVAFGQGVDPLEITLPNGKVLHFQTAEQKAKFEAAQARKTAVATGSLWAPATPPPTPTPARPSLGSSLDAPAGTKAGIVNPSAPPFTANYYLLAPDSWVGKKVTLAVGYLTPRNDAEHTDGMVRMLASTYNSSVTSGGDTDHGGYITVLAKPTVATRLMQQCGTSVQYSNGWRLKVTLIRGQVAKLDKPTGEDAAGRGYGFFVED